MDLTMNSCSHLPPNPSALIEQLKRSLVPPKWKDSVRVVSLSEHRQAALTLAHAFAADDYAQYLVDPGPSTAEDKWKLHVDIMTYAVAAHCISGLVTTIGPDYDSVALWLPPGKDLDGWWTLLRSGLWRLKFQLSTEGKKRYFDEILPLLHDTKADVLGRQRDGDAWYLVYLGTKPDSRGRGYAGRLLGDLVGRADVENRPVYLESSALSNNDYYAKFGFSVRRDIFLERGQAPVRLSIMVREPRQGGGTKGADRDVDTMGMTPSSPVSLARSSAESSSLPSSTSNLTLSSSSSVSSLGGDEEGDEVGEVGAVDKVV